MGKSDFVTIYTDASWHSETKKARWAFYAKCTWGTMMEHGDVQDRKVHSSNEAEMFAICMAIWKCLKKWPGVIGFFVNTDSMHCCQVWWPFRRDPHGNACLKMRERLTPHLQGRWVKVKHVLGHQEGDDIRTRLNNLVDSLASQRQRKKS